MSARLTKYWTQTTEEAYGMSGMKGRYGEVLFFQMLERENISAKDYEDQRAKQLAGVDIEAGKYTIDVKANLEDGVFFIEVDPKGWLFNPKKISDVIVHIDVATQSVVWYMRNVAKSKIICSEYRTLVKITPSNIRTDFMHTDCNDLYRLLRS